MTDEQNTDHSATPPQVEKPVHAERHKQGWRPMHVTKGMLAASAAGVLALGVLLGGVGTALIGSGGEASLLLKPATITSLTDSSSSVAIAGKVSEIFGNKLIVEDSSGRALVETGPPGRFAALVEKGETVTVQGRFDDGFMRAKVLVHEDGRVVDLGPKKPPFDALKSELARLAGR